MTSVRSATQPPATKPLTAKGLATRARIIEGAGQLLRSDDAGDITLDDVRDATGTSNGQIFHYFPGGKEDLLLAVVRREADLVLEDQQPYLDDLGSWASWEGWRDAVVARYREQGTRCPLDALMRQVGGTPGAGDVVRSLIGRWEGRLAAGIRVMQDAGEADPRLAPERTAAGIVAAVQGGVVILRSTGETTHLEAALELVLGHLRRPPTSC